MNLDWSRMGEMEYIDRMGRDGLELFRRNKKVVIVGSFAFVFIFVFVFVLAILLQTVVDFVPTCFHLVEDQQRLSSNVKKLEASVHVNLHQVDAGEAVGKFENLLSG